MRGTETSLQIFRIFINSLGAFQLPFDSLAAKDLVLLRRESRPPLLVGELGLRLHVPRVPAGQRTTSDKAMNCVAAAATTRRWKIS